MLADAPNLFYVIGLPFGGMLVALVLCIGIYKVLGSVLHLR